MHQEFPSQPHLTRLNYRHFIAIGNKANLLPTQPFFAIISAVSQEF